VASRASVSVVHSIQNIRIQNGCSRKKRLIASKLWPSRRLLLTARLIYYARKS
jgi:hypothetical protein